MTFDGPIAILGGSGQLGSEVCKLLSGRLGVVAPGRQTLDLACLADVRIWLDGNQPNLIINTAAYTDVDGAESHKDAAYTLNSDLPTVLANWCRKNGARLLHFSSDYTLRGLDNVAQDEQALVLPLNWYGKTKAIGDAAIKKSQCEALILRTSWVYSDHHKNFMLSIIRQAFQKEIISVVNDQVGTPTPAHWLAEIAVTCVDQWNPAMPKLMNAVPEGFISWLGFAEAIVAILVKNGFEVRAKELKPVTSLSLGQAAVRPNNSRLSNKKLAGFVGKPLDNWTAFLHDLACNAARQIQK